jgi:protein-disulfide isomerase
MKASISAGAMALALLLSGCGGEDNKGSGTSAGAGKTAASVPAPNGGDWTQMVQQTPEGGFRMGNPNAPVKLLEYASISCSHCAEFDEAASEALRNNYVRSGRVSWEYRPFMIFPTDPGIFMLLQCRGPQTFFQLTDQLYADQRNWLGKLQALSPAQQQQLGAMAPQQQIAALVQATGTDQFFRQRGMPEAQISSCLANQQSLQQLMNVTSTGTSEYKVSGTPTFFVNGELVNDLQPPYWPGVETALKAAGG